MSQRHSAVSFTKSESASNLNDVFDDDATQLSMAPELQLYLARVSQESGCWGKCVPIPFERAATRSWWDPTFDSDLLEEQYRHSSFQHNRLKFRYALLYILLTSTSWFLYFIISGCTSPTSGYWSITCTLIIEMIVFVSSMFLLTFSKIFVSRMLTISLTVSISLCALGLLFVVLPAVHTDNEPPRMLDMSPLGHFSLCIEILLLIYTVMPLRLYISISVGITYSTLFELLTWTYRTPSFDGHAMALRSMAHCCIHLIGLHILIMTNVRLRNTFMKVGQSLLVRRQLESEQKLKEKMIESLMPARVAKLVLNDDANFMRSDAAARHSNSGADIHSLFRPFNMNRLDNVSILFADIVGFTKMSGTKSADELVAILNTLFQRFDLLCGVHRCEKISTLGDCYYCVSGCPEPEEAHAKCAVEMGMAMINYIKQFDEKNSEGINIRVGVHTGTVLCGIVGTRRFRFDVWSNDVTLANRMESTGKPGLVHVSESTQNLLPDCYLLEEGEQVFGLRTYFIIGRKSERVSTSFSNSLKATTLLQLVVSPPTSPPSVSPHTRPRVLSCCDSSTSKLKPQSLIQNPALLSPDACKIKASSLPSILDSDNEQLEETIEQSNGENTITPTSTASSGRYSVKLKNWKIPKFLRKNSNAPETIMPDDPSRSSAGDDAGYAQIPMIIETKNEETIDVKSYISQSRSDVGQFEYSPNEFTRFMRAGSYRSQYGRTANEWSYLSRAGSYRSKRGKSPINDIVPSERTRSATVVLGHQDRNKRHNLDVPAYRLSATLIYDQISTGPSVNSRKDSGIKSNSRRSSIVQIEPRHTTDSFQQHRVSGYFTSSQSSINSPQYASRLHGPFLGKCIQSLRKQSDRQLIRCVQENSKSRRSYFIKPPLSPISLFFAEDEMEYEYRTNVHAMHSAADSLTMANATLNTYFDIFVSAVVFFAISTGLFLMRRGEERTSIVWLCVFCMFCFVQISAVAMSFPRISYLCDFYLNFIPKWYRWNVFGGILVCLPIVSVLVNCPLNCPFGGLTSALYNCLFFVGLVHFCNFTQLNCWMKNILATICCLAYIICSLHCPLSLERETLHSDNETIFGNQTSRETSHSINQWEILMDILLLLVLVWVLNREFEICYRLSFHANHVATRDRFHVQCLKNQADWLIYNIVPEHVAEQLKQNAKYSEHFENVAIMFASIVNFNEMYDESYLGGKEFLRVLNELIGDFDELLTLPQFQSVEKIKTIGSTFMAASGLDSKMRLQQSDEHSHLYALMDFAIAMQRVVDNFNRNLLEFNLVLRIGYNFGDVTAAVIGETMLYYDIWGDAVNVAARMDTTGVNERIQVGEHCLSILSEKYDFEPRGAVYVKGKDNMNVFLLLRKRDVDDDDDYIPDIDADV